MKKLLLTTLISIIAITGLSFAAMASSTPSTIVYNNVAGYKIVTNVTTAANLFSKQNFDVTAASVSGDGIYSFVNGSPDSIVGTLNATSSAQTTNGIFYKSAGVFINEDLTSQFLVPEPQLTSSYSYLGFGFLNGGGFESGFSITLGNGNVIPVAVLDYDNSNNLTVYNGIYLYNKNTVDYSSSDSNGVITLNITIS